MEIESTQCCAVGEISELSNHRTPEDAMADFCEITLGCMCRCHKRDDPCDPCEGKGCYGAADGLGNLYTFTGVVNGGYEDKTYGPKFKAFILRHKLGTVVESRGRPNILNHPDHIVKVWVWSVNQRNLKSWYRQHRKEE